MKKIPLALAVLLNVALFSCEENPDVEPNPTPTDTTAASAALLTKTTLTSGSSVNTTIYQYDAQKRLAWFSNTSTKADFFEDTSKIYRNAAGQITRIVYSSDTSRKFPDPKLDSVVYTVFYNAGKYTHKILDYKSYNVQFRDSSAYTYDAQNRITKDESYYFDFKTTKQYLPATKTELTYNAAGDVTSAKVVYYKVDGVNDYPFEIVYTYDDKGVNLLNLSNEAVVLGMMQNFSAHIPKTVVSTYPETQYNRSLTYAYTYNTKYYPLKADITDAATGTKSTMQFTYQ